MIQFSVTLGITPGYQHANEFAWMQQTGLGYVEHTWRTAMEIERTRSNITVGAVLMPSVAVYPTEFGCPPAGEITVTVAGTKHPLDISTQAAWKAAVLRVVDEVRNQLEQSTAMVSFFQADVEYLTNVGKTDAPH